MRLLATISLMCLVACSAKPKPLVPEPPPRIVTIDPPACLIPDPPGPVALDSLKFVATPAGVVAQLNDIEWRHLVAHEAAWQTFAAKAKRCEVAK